MKLIALTLCALVASITGAPNTYDSRILGGDLVSDPALSYYVVAISDNKLGQHLCSGWIYSETVVVTTAACVNGKLPADLTITVGMTSQLRPNPDQKDYNPTEVLPNPGFNASTLKDNIALLKMTTAMTFSNYVYYVYYDELDEAISPLSLMGWGATTEGGLASLRLRKGDLALKTHTECTNFYGTLGYSSNYMICAGSPTGATTPVSPCQYDEGSPLTQRVGAETIAVGMYSRNLGCSGTPPPPSVFVRIASYFSWLKSVAGAQALPTTTVPSTIPTAPCDPGAGCVTPAPGK